MADLTGGAIPTGDGPFFGWTGYGNTPPIRHSAPHEAASRFFALAYQAASAIRANGAGRGMIEEEFSGQFDAATR